MFLFSKVTKTGKILRWEKIAEEVNQHGNDRTVEQLQKKITTIKSEVSNKYIMLFTEYLTYEIN